MRRTKKKPHKQAAVISAGVALGLALLPQFRVAALAMACVTVFFAWPRPKHWLCENCGVAFTTASLQAPPSDRDRTPGGWDKDSAL